MAGLSVTGQGRDFGIRVSGTDSLVRDNFITDTARPTGGGTSQGIESRVASVNISDNTVSNMTLCISYNGLGTGFFAGNTVTSCDVNFTGGTAGHGNNPAM